MSEGALTAIPSRPVRFGILCDGPTLLAWQARSVEALLRVPGVILAVLIFPEASPPDHPVSRPVRAAPLPFRAYLGLRPPRALRPVDMTAVFEKIPSVPCGEITQEESLQSFDQTDVRRIREHDLDFLLQFGFGFLRGDVLNAGRYGVWSFRHSAELPYPGVSPTIWPILDDDPVTAALLERVTDRRDGGIVGAPIADFLDPTREKPVRWLRPPGDGRFIADPFGARIDDAVHIVYEDFRYSTSKGLIATMEATMEGPARMPRVAIELPVPASYPYIIEDRGRIYCVPETSEAREVSLYRAVEFPMKWEKASTMLTGVAALDGTVFRHESRWWLAHTDRDAGQYVHLFLWYASTLEGSWEPHPLNPVKSDVRSSRPAGTPFLHEGSLYRPAQDCSRIYGGRIVINRVSRLTPTEFAEEPAAVVEPFAKSPFPDGIHTISRVGDVTLIDSKRYRFIPSAIPYVLRHR